MPCYLLTGLPDDILHADLDMQDIVCFLGWTSRYIGFLWWMIHHPDNSYRTSICRNLGEGNANANGRGRQGQGEGEKEGEKEGKGKGTIIVLSCIPM